MTNETLRISDLDSRDAFFDEVYALAQNDPNVIFLTADMGAFSLVRFKKDFPKQFINVGVFEQSMVSIAAGLALGGKKVFIYSIIPFVTLRCFEQIKVDLCCMNLPVTIVGIGAGLTYSGDGPTHQGVHDLAAMRVLPEMTIFNPSDSSCTQACAQMAYKSTSPTYVRIEKGRLPLIYKEKNDFSDGLTELKKGKDITIISTGIMVAQALRVAEILEQSSFSTGVVDLYRIKPLNTELLEKILSSLKYVVSLEENALTGGIGSALSEFLIDHNLRVPLKRVTLPDQHYFEPYGREVLQKIYKLDTENVASTIINWIKG